MVTQEEVARISLSMGLSVLSRSSQQGEAGEGSRPLLQATPDILFAIAS